jgi:hypothetical protein
MRGRALAGPVISLLASHQQMRFADHAAWLAHLDHLGITALRVTPEPADRFAGHWFASRPNPTSIATEGALWGSVQAHGLLPDKVIVSDDAGQFVIGQHALCWVHAERLVHKLDTFTEFQRSAQAFMRELIWWFYADLKSYCLEPTARRRGELRVRFDRIFRRRTGFVTLDPLLERQHANKSELLMALNRPEISLHTNGSERDIRSHVTKRKISGGTRSNRDRDCRDAFLGLLRTTAKLGIAFWDCLGNRLRIPGQAMARICPTSSAVAASPLDPCCPGFCPGYQTDAVSHGNRPIPSASLLASRGGNPLWEKASDCSPIAGRQPASPRASIFSRSLTRRRLARPWIGQRLAVFSRLRHP